MTAQIRPNRMEVSDRFPMLGFSIRVDEPNTEAEIVLANDVSLFDPQNRSRRTPQSFYSSREGGTLMVPRGDGVFVVAPTVLERFIGSEKLYFGLATGRSANGGLKVDALPRDGSPYVSLRAFTGRTLRRAYGKAGIVAPRMDWTGDAPRPGSESPAANDHAGAPPAPPPASSRPYDDGFGPMPAIPAREAAWRSAVAMRRPPGRVALSLGSGTTAGDALDWIRKKVEQAVSAVGSDVSPPALIELGSASSTFITAWKAVFGLTGLFVPANGFLASLPGLSADSGVTLSVGPALDTPFFGGGIGVVFAPNGEVALFGIGEISLDLSSLKDFVTKLKLALDLKFKLGYNHSGIAGFASLGKVASLTVGEEVVVGAEVWLDSSGSGLGGAVSIGVGFALELSADEQVRRAVPPQRIVANRSVAMRRPPGRVALSLGSGTTAGDALDWIRKKVEQAVSAVGSDVSPPALIELGSASSTFITAWKAVFGLTGLFVPANGFLASLPGLSADSGVTLSVGPALDTPFFGGGIGVVFAPNGEVALFGIGEISLDLSSLKDFVTKLKLALDLKFKLGYNHSGIAGFASLGKVASLTVGEEVVVGAEVWLDSSGSGLGGAVSIGVGFALELSADEQVRRAVPPQRIVANRSVAMRRPPGRVALSLGSGTTAGDALDWIRKKVEQAVSAVGSDVSPPALIELGSASSTFITAWKAVFGLTGLFVPANGFLASLPGLSADSGVTLSVGPALDTPFFGGGIGVVFAPNGEVALFGIGEISLDLSSLKDFVTKLKLALDLKFKLGYNHSGIAGFASLGKVASLTVGEEVVVGAEVWLDSSGSGLGGAVSIGVGFALELSADAATPANRGDARLRALQIGGPFAGRVGEALDRGFDPNAMQSLLDTLDPQAPPARPMGVRGQPLAQAKAVTRSVNWDEVELIAQPTNMSCWAAAAAMVVGWRDQVCLTPDSVAQICSRSTANGLGRSEVEPFAGQMGLAVDPPQCYSAEGFYDLLTYSGPLWVGKIAVAGSNAGHAVVVTGMYSEGNNHFVRVADPWDRVVGTPGTPGAYASTHSTGSRYIMRYEDFQNEYELAATAYPQILHSGGTFGRSPKTSTSAAPQGYAMAAAPRLRAKARAPGPTRGLSAVEPVSIGGAPVTTVSETSGDVSWQLPYWSGRKHPDDLPPAEEAPYQAGVVELKGWPTVGATRAACNIRWFYNGSSLGPVHVERGEAAKEAGWGLLVSGNIENDTRLHPRSASATVPGPQIVPAVCVALTHEFHSDAAGTDLVATSRVTLYADGTHEIDNEWTRTGEGGIPAGTEARDSERGYAAPAKTGQAA